jgi:photosystem II stability/assembly factor-like uncharacterized protein
MESKKFFLFVIIVFSFLTFNCYSQQFGWVPLTSPNASGLFRNIYVSGNEAWLLNINAIYYSNNYPATQFSQIFTPANTLNAMCFIIQNGNKYGWAVGTSSLGARTTDGTNWTSMSLSGTSTYNCVFFPTTSIGFASGTDNYLHKTVNGGNNWLGVGAGLSVSNVNTLFFADTSIGYAGTSDPRLAKTTDGGVTWVDDGDITGTITDIYFIDTNHGWAVGGTDILTYDSGIWTQQNNTTGFSLYSVFFLNENEGWIVGNGGTILHSTDGGVNWTAQASGTVALLRDVFFTSATNGYVVGNSGTILHYTQITDIDDVTTQPTEFKLEQNYPNPFNPITKIKFTIPTPPSSSPLAKGRNEVGFVSLKVYDVLGNEVATLVNEEKAPGIYETEFNPASSIKNPASGIYFYQLKAGDYLETKKMILMK